MSAGRALWVSQHLCAARERIPCGRGGLQVASLRVGAVVVEVTCRSLACVLELVVAEVACRSRACAWALVVATDPGCWADEGELALEPSRPLVCRVTAASVSVRELIPEQLLGEEAGSQLAQPVGLSRLRLRAAPPSAH